MRVYELIVRLRNKKCRKGYIWCIDGSFVSPSRFEESDKAAFGYAIDDHTVVRLKRTVSEYTWSKAKSYCTECDNDGRYGYLPSKDDLSLLYSSIKLGKMTNDLIEAELYDECNYRSIRANTSMDSSWYFIWSSDEYNSSYAYYVYYAGVCIPTSKSNTAYVIPFFKF